MGSDEKVYRLAVDHGDFAALVYTWLIPHADDDAIARGTPFELWTRVTPAHPKGVAGFEEALRAIQAVGLAVLAEKAVAFAPDSFYRYQTYIPTEKRRSEHPPAGFTPPAAKTPSSGEIAAYPLPLPLPLPSPSPSPSLALHPSQDQNASDEERVHSASETESAESADRPRVKRVQRVHNAEHPTPEQVLELWNQHRGHLPEAHKLTEQRRQHIAARNRESGRDTAWWAAYFTRIEATAFLRGEGRKGWRADLDWAVASEHHVTRVHEGAYDEAPATLTNGHIPLGKAGQAAEALRALERREP